LSLSQFEMEPKIENSIVIGYGSAVDMDDAEWCIVLGQNIHFKRGFGTIVIGDNVLLDDEPKIQSIVTRGVNVMNYEELRLYLLKLFEEMKIIPSVQDWLDNPCNILIGRGSSEIECKGKGNIVIGNESYVVNNASNCIIIGHKMRAYKDNALVIGSKELPVPERFQKKE
jgi:hypothetical protein